MVIKKLKGENYYEKGGKIMKKLRFVSFSLISIFLLFLSVFSISITVKGNSLDLSPVFSISNYQWDYSSTSITATSSYLYGHFSFSQTIDIPDNQYSFLTLDIEGSYDLGIEFEVADELGEYVDTFSIDGEDFLDTNCVFSVVFNYAPGSTRPNTTVYITDKTVLRNLITTYQSTYVIVENPFPKNILTSLTIHGNFPFDDYPAGAIKGTQPFDSILEYYFWDYTMHINLYQDLYYKGYTDGHNLGYTSGYTVGYNKGLSEGESVGYTNGYNVGYNEGILVGESEAYEEGFKAGQKSKLAENNEKFYNGIEKWLVPAIITVIALGGFVTIASIKRREQ